MAINPIKGHIFVRDNGNNTAVVLEVSEEAKQFCNVGDVVKIDSQIKTKSNFGFKVEEKIIHYTDLK